MAILIILAVTGILLLSLDLYLLYRNSKIYKFRLRLLQNVSSEAKLLINHGKPWQFLYEAFGSVEYNDMMKTVKIFKPFSLFYSETAIGELARHTEAQIIRGE